MGHLLHVMYCVRGVGAGEAAPWHPRGARTAFWLRDDRRLLDTGASLAPRPRFLQRAEVSAAPGRLAVECWLSHAGLSVRRVLL